MKLSHNQKKLGIICGVIGAVQGGVWMVLSLISIILHYAPPTLKINNSTFGEILNLVLYYRFISDDVVQGVQGTVVRPQDFVVFMFFYLFLGAIWCGLSVAQLIAIISMKTRECLIMSANGLLTLVISIIDVIFWGLLLREYVDCHMETDILVQTLCYVSTGIVMTLAIRGYTLWLFNLIMSYLLISVGIKNLQYRRHWAERNIKSIPRAKLHDDFSLRRPEPIYSHDPTIDDRRERSNSPIFSDSDIRPSAVDRTRASRLPTVPINEYPSHPSSYPNRGFDGERGLSRNNSPVFSDSESRPRFLDRSRTSRAPAEPVNPRQPAYLSHEPNRQPSFLNRGNKREQGPSQPRSLGDRAGRFDY